MHASGQSSGSISALVCFCPWKCSVILRPCVKLELTSWLCKVIKLGSSRLISSLLHLQNEFPPPPLDRFCLEWVVQQHLVWVVDTNFIFIIAHHWSWLSLSWSSLRSGTAAISAHRTHIMYIFLCYGQQEILFDSFLFLVSSKNILFGHSVLFDTVVPTHLGSGCIQVIECLGLKTIVHIYIYISGSPYFLLAHSLFSELSGVLCFTYAVYSPCKLHT